MTEAAKRVAELRSYQARRSQIRILNMGRKNFSPWCSESTTAGYIVLGEKYLNDMVDKLPRITELNRAWEEAVSSGYSIYLGKRFGPKAFKDSSAWNSKTETGIVACEKYSKFFGSSFRAPRSVSEPTHIPSVFSNLNDAIEASRYITELKEDWDEEGSPSYSKSTWTRATRFLKKHALSLWQDHRVAIEVPQILPGPDGSIDIRWRTDKRELVINVPANVNEPASYYGDDKEEGTDTAIRGKNLDLSASSDWIFLWLMK